MSRAAFPGRLHSRFGDIQWPSNSPNLTAAGFFMKIFESSKFYSLPSSDINGIKNAIRQEIANVTHDTTTP
jgi:hypothetical protein